MLVCPLCRLTLGDNETTCPRDGREGVNADPMPVPEQVRQRFDIVQPYGRGASGDLYLVDDRQSGRRGVLKLVRIPEQTTPAEKARLKRELVKQATLAHDVLSVPLATGEADGNPWIFRDWHEGVSLAVRLARGGALAVPEALTIAAQVSSALDELHRAGLLHRDLKPGHIIVEPQPSGLPRVHVVDAGIAARLETGAVFDVMGTPEYLSPEQAKGKLVSFRSDLYALGCILYEMLGGAPPFQGTTEDLLKAHADETAPTLQMEMPAGVSTLLARLLSKEPRERPFSAQQVRRALQPFLPEDASSKREATQAFDNGADVKRRVPSPKTSGTLRPPSGGPPGAAASKGASVPPPPPKGAKGASVPPPKKSADHTDELDVLDLEQAEDLVASAEAKKPVRQTSKTLMGMPVRDSSKPSADGTEELSAMDLAQAEEILKAPQVAAAAGLGALVGDATPAASSPAAAPPWQADELRMTDPGGTAAPSSASASDDDDDGEEGDLDYDDLAETVMYDRDKEEAEAEAAAAAATASAAEDAVTPVPVARPAPAPAKKKSGKPWGLIVLAVLAGGCLFSTVGIGGALWYLASEAEDAIVAGVDDLGLDPSSTAPPDVWGTPEPTPAPMPEPAIVAPPPMPAPMPMPEPAVVEEPAVAEPAPTPAPAEAPREEPTRTETARTETTRTESERPSRTETARTESARTETASAGGGSAGRFEAVREQALDHFRARRFPQAAQAYQEATRLNPRHAGSYSGLGACYMAMGQYPRAVQAYQRAVSLSPRHAGYYAALGQAYHASGDTGRARQAYTRALALDPNNRAARAGVERL